MGSIKTSNDPLLTRPGAAGTAGTARSQDSAPTVAAEKRAHQPAPSAQFNGCVSSFNGWFTSF